MSETQKEENDHGRDMVQIAMNDESFPIHRGRRTVAEIKAACKVNPAWVIQQIGKDGVPVILGDDAAVTIKGDERFISHVAGGGSS